MSKRKSFPARNLPKYIMQWTALAAILFFLTGLAGLVFPEMEKADPEAYCPMGGLQAFCTYLVRGSLPCSMTTMQIVMGLALAATVIFLGKLFCSYLCPIGTVEDLLTEARRALRIKTIKIKSFGIADRILRVIKYGLLFLIFYMTCSSSELFCKKIDPYYAVATGFQGEIILWLSIVIVALVIVLGFFIDRFWCRYICPLGAASNSLKFYLPLGLVLLAFWVLSLLGVSVHWVWILATFCLVAYLLEAFHSKPKFQAIHLVRDEQLCNKCGLCSKRCPYQVSIGSFGARVDSVDCTLCGDCIGVCAQKALNFSVCKPVKKASCLRRMLPAFLAIILLVAAFCFGNQFELPTIDETWNMENVDESKLEKMEMSGLRTIKCFGSSMAFKARMEKVPGVYGVKTYVGKHRIVVLYDPAKISEEKLQQLIFVPSRFRVSSPNPYEIPSLKVYTIRVEKMYDKFDLNYLGLQMRNTDKKIYGVESEFDCPVRVRVFADPSEQLDKEWFKEIVNRESLDMPVHGGGVKKAPMNLEFVRMEEGVDSVATTEFLEKMFDGFYATYNGRYDGADGQKVVRKRIEQYAGKKQFIYELADTNYQKPIVRRALPFLSNHISREEGIISMKLTLNKEYVPALQIRYAAPATAEKIWSLLQEEMWTITYKVDDVRQEKPRLVFRKEGVTFPVTE
ncbi:MAG: 4Fe-4S binding protein [Bacteroidales bacterium]|nr:4Fe-4S binding protein [Bacteroidales bacterium]